MTNVFEITIRTKDGRERRELAWLPNEAVWHDLYSRAHRNGLELTINKFNF